MASFESLWHGLMENWKSNLSAIERQFFTRLETDNERDAFRIVRSFARKAEQDGAADFPIVRDNLAPGWASPAKVRRGFGTSSPG